MKLILKVARTELRNLFYSPVAWFLTIAFLVQCALFYTITAENMARFQEVLAENSKDFDGFDNSVTGMMFYGPKGIFNSVLQNIFLFVPLLTMGLINREINNGTIKLLYSSPLTTRQLVMGKYLAIMAYNMLLVAIVAVFVILGAFSIQHAEIGWLLSSLFTFFLLVCTYTAIGIFMSSLTNYQIVAAIGTFLTLFVLNWIGDLWQQYDFVRDITYFLDIKSRAIKLLRGLLNTNDVLYFIIIIVMFLGFTLFKLKGARESAPGYKKAGRYIALVVICLTTGYIFSRPGMIGYLDTTERKVNTIHANTQAILKEFDKNEPVEVTLYGNLLGAGYNAGALPQVRNTYLWDMWERYLRFMPNLKFNYVNYYDVKDSDSSLYRQFPGKDLESIAKIVAKAIGTTTNNLLPPDEIRKKINLMDENLRVVMHLKYKGKTTFLRTFDDQLFWPMEPEVSAAFKRLLQNEMPKILFSSGNLERSIYKTGEREYFVAVKDKDIRSALINIGFDTDTINLETSDIPAGITALVVADPKTALSDTKKQKIRNFIDNGGNAFFLSEPGKQHILNEVLMEHGIELLPGTLVEISKNETPDKIKPLMTLQSVELAKESVFSREVLKIYAKGIDAEEMISGTTAIKLHPGSSFKPFPLLTTLEKHKGWMKAGRLVTDSVPPVFSPQEGDYRDSSFQVLSAFTRNINNREQRLLVMGDADFLSFMRQSGGPMMQPLFSYLDYNEFPNFAARPDPKDVLLNIGENMATVQVWVFLYILPAAVLLLGIILLVRRKRK